MSSELGSKPVETRFDHLAPPSRRLRVRHGFGAVVRAMKTNRNVEILSPPQQALLNQLLPVARIATAGGNEHLPVRLRTHSIICGPSGGGKSFVASSLGMRLGLPIMVINVSSWVVLSAKNEPWTFSLICDWLGGLHGKGGILVLDEIEKLTIPNITDWNSLVMLELHSLLDGLIPQAARLPSSASPSGDLWGESEADEPPDPALRTKLAECLRNRVFVVACGAWQAAWGVMKAEIGFGSTVPQQSAPSSTQLLSISPELRKRLRNEVAWLPPLGLADYLTVSANIASQIRDPKILREWNALEEAAIQEAMANGLGMRVFEELMLSAMLSAKGRQEPRLETIDPPSI